MRLKEKAAFIRHTLAKLFPSPPIPLKHKDHFTLLVAVMLSARCTDKRVNLITPILFAKADTPAKMAKIPLQTLISIIKPCGLAPSKAKALIGTSKLLLEKHHGHVPSTFQELEALPGVGHKTASVLMVQAFHKNAFPVDTHIFRLARRWGLSKGKTVKRVEEDLKKLFPEESWRDLHLQIIEAGRSFCPARGHDAKNCPICSPLRATVPFGNKSREESPKDRRQR